MSLWGKTPPNPPKAAAPTPAPAPTPTLAQVATDPAKMQRLLIAAQGGSHAAKQLLHQIMAAGLMPKQAVGLAAAQQSPIVNPVAGEPRKQSNARFRSFCERYLVTRSVYFRTDPVDLQKDIWSCILDAKMIYKLIGEVGLNVED